MSLCRAQRLQDHDAYLSGHILGKVNPALSVVSRSAPIIDSGALDLSGQGLQHGEPLLILL